MIVKKDINFKIVLLVSVFLMLSCIKNKEIIKSDITEKLQPEFNLAASEYEIFIYQPNWHWTFKNATPTSISELELIEIEKIIQVAILANNEKQKNEVSNHNKYNKNEPIVATGYEIQLEGYKRQYVPVINENGQKEVWINFFCDALGDGAPGNEQWRTTLVLVEDGGNCFYLIKVNLSTKMHALEINYNSY